jgi:putative tryptophan/tyrosine transport system substrate-binding protein
MKRRDFITLVGGAVTWPVSGRAQQTIPVVAFVFSGTASSTAAPYVTAFKLGLEAVGFIEGQNVAVEYHLPGGHDEGLPASLLALVDEVIE